MVELVRSLKGSAITNKRVCNNSATGQLDDPNPINTYVNVLPDAIILLGL